MDPDFNCSIDTCTEAYWDRCHVCFKDFCQIHNSEHFCSRPEASTAAARRPTVRNSAAGTRKRYTEKQKDIVRFLSKSYDAKYIGSILQLNKSLISRWTATPYIEDQIILVDALVSRPLNEAYHLQPEQRTFQENVRVFEYENRVDADDLVDPEEFSVLALAEEEHEEEPEDRHAEQYGAISRR